MFCYRCGGQMPDTAAACPQCGASAQQAPQPAPPPAVAAPTPAAASQPSSQPQPYYGQPPQQSEGKATASLVLGILSITCFGILAGIPAVILGHMAKSSIRKSGGRLTGDGKATGGLVMGYISLAMIPLVMAIAIPSLLRARMTANESAVMSSIRTVNTSQITYSTEYPTAGYAPDLATLGPGPSGSCTEGTQEHACLLDRVLGNANCGAGSWCVKNGYEYSLAAVCGDHGCTDYVIAARPLTEGTTGSKSYCSTTDAVVRYRHGTLLSPPTVEECQTWSPTL